MLDDEDTVGDESDAVVTPEDRLMALNESFMTSMTLLEGIKTAFVELDEDEGRDEISKALEHVQEAWMSRNRKLTELAPSEVEDDDA